MPLAQSPSLKHLRTHPVSLWLSSIALALGLSRSFPLYSHTLDHWLLTLASRESIPCGVLVLLGLVDENNAPPWETKYNRNEKIHAQHSAFLVQQQKIAAESKMSPDQARIARTARVAAELQQRTDEFGQKAAQERERAHNRQREAISSPRLDNTKATIAALTYLKAQRRIARDSGVQAVAEAMVMGVILQEESSIETCAILERWRAWCDRGGMTIEDLNELMDNKAEFCSAVCVMELVRDVSTKEESAVALDMRECVARWKNVRLG